MGHIQRKIEAAKKAKRAPYLKLNAEDAAVVKVVLEMNLKGIEPTYAQIANGVLMNNPEWAYGKNQRIIFHAKVKKLKEAGLLRVIDDYPARIAVDAELIPYFIDLFKACDVIAAKSAGNRSTNSYALNREALKAIENIAAMKIK